MGGPGADFVSALDPSCPGSIVADPAASLRRRVGGPGADFVSALDLPRPGSIATAPAVPCTPRENKGRDATPSGKREGEAPSAAQDRFEGSDKLLWVKWIASSVQYARLIQSDNS